MRPALLIALLASLLGLTSISHAQPAGEVTISEEARQQFAAGVSLLEDPSGPRYGEAYEAFLRAYAASPTPKIFSNLGLCAMMLERDGEAVQAYQHYLDEVKDVDRRERQKLQEDLRVLKAGAGTLVLTVTPKAVTLVDTRQPVSGPQVVNRYYLKDGQVSLLLRAGSHRLEVQASDHQSQVLDLDVKAGGKLSRELALARAGTPAPVPAAVPAPTPGPAPAPDAGPSPEPANTPAEPDSGGSGALVAGVVILVVSAAVGVGAGVTGGLALKAKSDYDSYQNGGDRSDAESVRSQGETLNLVTDVLIGTAAAGAVAGLVLLIVGASSDDGDSAALQILPDLVEGGGAGAQLRLSF